MARWRPEEITFQIDDDMTEAGVWAFVVNVPGYMLKVIADEGKISSDGKLITLSGVHIQGARANEIGWTNLRLIGDRICEVSGYDELWIQGGVRTTGANPGRAQGHLRFKRRRCARTPEESG